MYASPLAASNLSSYLAAPGAVQPLHDDSPEVRRGRDKLPDYLPIEPMLARLLPKRGRLLEIGAYSGQLLEQFRRAGWDVLGVEPDGRGVEYARQRLGIDVRQGTLESVMLDPDSIDAALLIHVIEHVDDPAAVVRAAARVLRPDGVFVVETPTYDTLTYRLLGRRERNLSCDGHIFFYTERTLTTVLKKNGFDIVRVERVGRTMSLARLLAVVGVISKSDRLKQALAAFGDRMGLHERHIHLNARDMVRVYARRRAA